MDLSNIICVLFKLFLIEIQIPVLIDCIFLDLLGHCAFSITAVHSFIFNFIKRECQTFFFLFIDL